MGIDTGAPKWKKSEQRHAADTNRPEPASFFQRRLPVALERTRYTLARFFRRLWALTFTSIKEIIKDDCLNLSAQISYYALFSTFPLILGIVLAVSFIFQSQEARDNLLSMISKVIPNSAVDVSKIVDEALKQTSHLHPIFFVFFFISLIWGGSGVFDSISNSLNKMWQVPGQQRSFFESLWMRFVLFGFFILLLVGSLGTSVAYDVVKNFAETNPQLSFYLKDNPIWGWLSLLIPWTLNFLTFMLIYRVVPQRKVTWGDVWPGALVTTILLELIKIGFSFYVTKVVNYSNTYGSLSSVIVFIFWLYLLAVAIMVGGEFSSVYAEMRGEKHPTKLARQGHLAQAEPEAPATGQTPEEMGDKSLDYSYVCEEIACYYACKEPVGERIPAHSEKETGH
ncbi:MAG TPA: YihY/virulence factor BrkB family protein [Chloroflexia bacterium]|nr:YihY/virulence factor BrkB family protein [Chloroflexia bacterium]